MDFYFQTQWLVVRPSTFRFRNAIVSRSIQNPPIPPTWVCASGLTDETSQILGKWLRIMFESFLSCFVPSIELYYGPWLHSHSQALWKDYSGKIGVDGWNLISLDTMLNENIGNPKTPDTTKSTNPGALMVWQLVTQGTIPQCQRRDASLLRSHWSLPLLLLLLWVFSVSTRISQSSSGTADASPDWSA